MKQQKNTCLKEIMMHKRFMTLENTSTLKRKVMFLKFLDLISQSLTKL